MTLIKTGGYRWTPADIGWGSRGPKADSQILGYHATKPGGSKGSMKDTEREAATVNVWNVVAVYALFRGTELVYVGEGILGERLKKHRQSEHLRGEWDRFTWLSPWEYDASTVVQGGQATISEPLAFAPFSSSKAVVELLELVSIQLAHPRENSQNPSNQHQITWLTQFPSKYADVTPERAAREVLALKEAIDGLASKIDRLTQQK